MNTRLQIMTFLGFLLLLLLAYWFAEQPIAVGLVPVPFDKLVHALFGASAAVMLWIIMGQKGARYIVGIVALLSGLEEWHQSFLPGRVPDFYDFLSAAIAATICVVFLRYIVSRYEPIE